MEGIIFLAVLYFIIAAIVRKSKEAGWKPNFKNTNADPDARHANGSHVQHAKRRAEPGRPAPTRMVPTPRTQEPYQPIQSMLVHSDRLYDYTGSLGAQTGEGSLSTEGNASPTGSLSAAGLTEGASAGQGGEVFTPDVLAEYQRPTLYAYQTVQNGADIRVLPGEWNRDELVRAVVMNEILQPPRGRRYNHG